VEDGDQEVFQFNLLTLGWEFNRVVAGMENDKITGGAHCILICFSRRKLGNDGTSSIPLAFGRIGKITAIG